MKRRRSIAGSAWVVAAATFVGCGGVYDSAVTGVVTIDGSPLAKGTVSFLPAGGGPAGFSVIDSSGGYVIRTGREEGLRPGPYNVCVTANEPGAPSKDGGPTPLGKALIPEWYRDPAYSGLRFEVAPGDQEINLELKSSPPPSGWKPPRPVRRR